MVAASQVGVQAIYLCFVKQAVFDDREGGWGIATKTQAYGATDFIAIAERERERVPDFNFVIDPITEGVKSRTIGYVHCDF